METFNLKTASTYINNLLLSRGLLRDGKPIEFAHPSRGEGGREATMAHIINLVHDLILKRDRDQEHRESVAATLRALRSESTRQTLALERLQSRNDDMSRQLSLAQSQERAARNALRTAESAARGLREEMGRLKTTVHQVRAQCANDIRKRDVQLQRLKSHLTSHQRGNRSGLVAASITITPAAGPFAGAASARDAAPDVDDPAYSLTQETTAFLTQLSQGLSDENDNLIGLVRSTLATLKELQGMPEALRHSPDGLSTIGEEPGDAPPALLHALPTSYDTLAADMDAVLDNLKNLLTNPNFVSVEEVELREEEIIKLRAGWDRMEARFRDTLGLMDRWRKRMAEGGDTINLEELKLGMGLGIGYGSGDKDESIVTAEDVDDEGSSGFDDDPVDADELDDPPSPEPDDVPDKTAGSDMFKLKLQPDPPALRESNGNVRSPVRSPRKVAFAASIPNTPTDIENVDTSEAGNGAIPSARSKTASNPTSSEARRSRPTSQDSRIPRQVRCDAMADRLARLVANVDLSSPSLDSEFTMDIYIDEPQTKKRLSSPHAHPEERSPKLTVQDKLKVAQAEAEAAALAEEIELKVVREEGGQDEEGNAEEDAAGAVAGSVAERKNRRRSSPVKKTRVGGRPKRRKSTLTPEELENLMGIE